MKDDSVREKIKKTNLKRYGIEFPLNSKENIEKRKAMKKLKKLVKRNMALHTICNQKYKKLENLTNGKYNAIKELCIQNNMEMK